MGRGMLSRSGPTNRLAIQGNRVIGFGLQGLTYPIRQPPFEMLGIQTGKQFAIERIAWAQEAAWPEQFEEQESLIATPLCNRQRGITMTEQTGDQTDEQVS